MQWWYYSRRTFANERRPNVRALTGGATYGAPARSRSSPHLCWRAWASGIQLRARRPGHACAPSSFVRCVLARARGPCRKHVRALFVLASEIFFSLCPPLCLFFSTDACLSGLSARRSPRKTQRTSSGHASSRLHRPPDDDAFRPAPHDFPRSACAWPRYVPAPRHSWRRHQASVYLRCHVPGSA